MHSHNYVVSHLLYIYIYAMRSMWIFPDCPWRTKNKREKTKDKDRDKGGKKRPGE